MVKEFLLGDNPFIGVSHLAQVKAREEKREATLRNKVEVIRAAVEGGATGFTFSTHQSNLELLHYMYDHHKDILGKLNYYILTPYVQAYVRKANITGTTSLVKTLLNNIIKNQFIDFALALVTGNVNKIAGLFINFELKPYLNVLPRNKIKAVLLHEILTELIIAYDLAQLLRELKSYVERRLGINFGLETRNIAQLQRYLKIVDINIDYIMTPMNPIGYQMAPSKRQAEKSILELSRNTKIIAINILASGAVTLEEAIAYLKDFRDSLYAVTSASTKPYRIKSNFLKLKQILG